MSGVLVNSLCVCVVCVQVCVHMHMSIHTFCVHASVCVRAYVIYVVCFKPHTVCACVMFLHSCMCIVY